MKDQLTYKVFFTVLLAVIGFFCVQYLNKLSEIEKNVVCIQKDIVKIQAEMITRADVKEMIIDELAKNRSINNEK